MSTAINFFLTPLAKGISLLFFRGGRKSKIVRLNQPDKFKVTLLLRQPSEAVNSASDLYKTRQSLARRSPKLVD